MDLKRVIIFIIGVNLFAWGTPLLISVIAPDNEAISAASVSISAFGPLIMVILIRLIYKETWKDAGLKFGFRNNRNFYYFGLLYPLLLIVLIIIISLIFGTADLNSEYPSELQSILGKMGIFLIPMLSMSISEEFGWRGYLEPTLRKINKSILMNHIIVGIIWGVWHFPILLFNNPDTGFQELLIVLVGCIALAIVYGQIRFLSNSVWPCVILHALSNTFMVAFATSNLLQIEDPYKDYISFNTTSIGVTSLWILTSLVFLAIFYRKRKETTISNKK